MRREVGSAVSSPTREKVTLHAYPAAHARTSSNLAVRIDGLTKRFGHIVAVDELSLAVSPGEIFGFLGPNGAGKSTTIRLLLGLIRPTSGGAQIFGIDAGDVARAHRYVAYVPADVALWPTLTGAEILELLRNVGPSVDVGYRAELVARFQLDLDRPGKDYSTGNRQKVALVAAFATRAPLLVLDEPTSGLDPLMEREFRRCVTEARGHGQTVFLSSHQLAEVEAVCDRVAILRSGRLVEVDTIADLRQLRRTLVEVSFTRCPTSAGQRPRSLEYRAPRRESVAFQSVRHTRAGSARPRPGRGHCTGDARANTRGDLPRLLRRAGTMTTAALPTTIAIPSTAAGRAIGRLTVRQIRRGTLLVATICAGTVRHRRGAVPDDVRGCH